MDHHDFEISWAERQAWEKALRPKKAKKKMRKLANKLKPKE